MKAISFHALDNCQTNATFCHVEKKEHKRRKVVQSRIELETFIEPMTFTELETHQPV